MPVDEASRTGEDRRTPFRKMHAWSPSSSILSSLRKENAQENPGMPCGH